MNNRLINPHIQSACAATITGLLSMTLIVGTANAADYTSANDGTWDGGTTWSPATPVPDPGNTASGADNVTIDGHNITVDRASYGNPTQDITFRNGSTLIIRNGGTLTGLTNGNHMRLADDAPGSLSGTGTISIEDGTFNLGVAQALQIGVRGGTGTLIVGNGIGATGSALFDLDDGELRTGSNSSGGPGGSANITVNTDGRIEDAYLHLADGPSGTTTMVLNGNASVDTRSINTANTIGEDGAATVTLNGNSILTSRSNDGLMISDNAGSTGILNLNGTSTLQYEGAANVGLLIGANSGSAGTVKLTGNSKLIAVPNVNSSARPFAVGFSGTGTLDIQDNAAVSANQQLVVGRNNGGLGTVKQTGGSVDITYQLSMGRIAGATGHYELTDGTLTTGGPFTVGHDGHGTITQNGGVATAPNVILGFQQTGSGTAEGTYTLNGGTLRTNTIDANTAGVSTFNWGDGTLQARQVNVNTTITFDGDLSTGYALDPNASSTLQLGNLSFSGTTIYDTLSVSGNLNLDSNSDVLDFWDNISSLRPLGGNAEITGEIELINVDGLISGQFDTVIGPGPDSRFFRFYETGAGPGQIDNGTLASSLNRNTAYLDYRDNEGIFFVYNITGTVPEPGTVSMVFIGLVLVKTLQRRRRKYA
jgi:T5SS/PEP-CTERM-associated repeat protein